MHLNTYIPVSGQVGSLFSKDKFVNVALAQ